MNEREQMLGTGHVGRAKDEEALRAARKLVQRMQTLHISRIDEMPRIELYLDQVLALVSAELSFMALPGEDLLTGSMVNNYVKQKIVPAPVRRRYTRRQVATLIFVCAFKRVFSISEVKGLYEACVDHGVNVAATYDELVGALERALAARFDVSELMGSEAEADGPAGATGAAEPTGDGGAAAAPVVPATEQVPAATVAEQVPVVSAAVPSVPVVALHDADGNAVAPELARLMSAGVEAVADKVFVEQALALYR